METSRASITTQEELQKQAEALENHCVCQDASSSCPVVGRHEKPDTAKHLPVLSDVQEEVTTVDNGEPLTSPSGAHVSPGLNSANVENEEPKDVNLLKDLDDDMNADVPRKVASSASVVSEASVAVSDASSPGTSSVVSSTGLSQASRTKPKAKKKTNGAKATLSKGSEESTKASAILIFDDGTGTQKTWTITCKPPGFAIRFPAMTVSRVTGPPASDHGIQEGWKLVKWGSSADALHALDSGQEKGELRQSYVSLIQGLTKARGSVRSSQHSQHSSAPEEVKLPASIPGKWAYDLEVSVLSAQNLRDADWGGKSDPYCVVSVQGRGKTTFKTKVVKNNQSPVWNHMERVTDLHDGDQLFFEVFDHDNLGKDARLGYTSIGWEELQDDSATLKETLVLEESGKKDKEPATMNVKINVLKRKLEMSSVTGSASVGMEKCYRLFVDLKSARGLRDADSFFGGGGSDPYCVCNIVGAGKAKFKTRALDNKTDPVWNESCVLGDFHKGDKLLFEVFDKDIGKKDDFLGKCEVSSQKVLAGFDSELKLQETGMVNKKPVEAFLSVAVKAQKRSAQGLAPFQGRRGLVDNGAVKYELEVQILSADGLRNADWLSSGSDPYCLVTVKSKGKSSVRTKTIKNEHSPLWRHTDKIEDFYHGDKLAISVRDADRMKHDDMLGQVQLQTEQLIPDGFEGDLKLRNTGWKDPENHPVFVTMVIKVISRQKVDS